MNQNQKKQTGRSMIEMLGVLAIIGVLSIGAISGYKMAIRKYRTNELLHEVYKRAGEISIQLANGRAQPSIAEFPNNAEFGFVNARVDNNDASRFFIEFNKPDPDICREILKRAEIDPRIVGSQPLVDCPDDCDNDQFRTISLFFKIDASEAHPEDYTGDQVGCLDAGYKWCYMGGIDYDCKEKDCCKGIDECKKCDSEAGVTGILTPGTSCNKGAGECNNYGECVAKVQTIPNEPIVSAGEMSYADAVNYCSTRGGMFTLADFNCDPDDGCVGAVLPGQGAASFWLAGNGDIGYYYETEAEAIGDYGSLQNMYDNTALVISRNKKGNVSVFAQDIGDPTITWTNKALCKGN